VDFARVLDTVTRFLDGRGFRYALVGAFALSAYGLSRATQDLDFAVDADARRDLISLFESLGYETLYCSEGYSNHVHRLSGLGRVDCIYVGEPTATSLFERATAAPILGRTIRVPRPEHLAAMKVLAMKNDPSRTFQDMADLQFILGLPGVDVGEIRAHFEQHGLLERFDELRKILDTTGP
jgi:predicted nucleotidyltransferase